MSIYVKDAGVWTLVSTAHLKNSGIWTEPKQGWVKDAGIWKQFYQIDTTPPPVPQLTLAIANNRYINVSVKAANALVPDLSAVRVLVSNTAFPSNQFASGYVGTPDNTYPTEAWSEFKYNSSGSHVETSTVIKEYPPNPSTSTTLVGGGTYYFSAWSVDTRGNWSAGVFASQKMPDRTTPPTNPVPVIKQTTWTADWSQTFNGDDTLRWNNVNLTQGYWNSFNGNQESVIGFPHESVINTLKNATITKVEIYMYAQKAYSKTFLARNLFHSASAPQPTMATIPRFGTPTFEEFATAQGKWYDITSMGTAGWKSGQVKGLTFQPNTFDRHYSGIFDGHTQSHPPKLRVTYQV